MTKKVISNVQDYLTVVGEDKIYPGYTGFWGA
jgi:hypothetical protein